MSNLNNKEFDSIDFWKSKCYQLRKLNKEFAKEIKRLKKKLRKQYINPYI